MPDSRGVTVNVHYSISELPQTSYKPRLADDRVGYFVTVLKDFSKKETTTTGSCATSRAGTWRRPIPSAEMSTPKEPIVFWLEKTIPFKYRKPIRDGILEWNKAFEKAGFYDAIEVRQQPDDATWDPGDIRYNTFRWITAGAGFAMGPSRVNPTTGQILDADIIFDADFLQVLEAGVRNVHAGERRAADRRADRPGRISGRDEADAGLHAGNRTARAARATCWAACRGSWRSGPPVMAARKRSDAEMEKLIMQGLKEVTMHEVGHTLGLAHNFKASTLYSLADLNDTSKTARDGHRRVGDGLQPGEHHAGRA